MKVVGLPLSSGKTHSLTRKKGLVEHILNGGRERISNQSPTCEVDSGFSRTTSKQIGAQPKREAEEEKFQGWHVLILTPS